MTAVSNTATSSALPRLDSFIAGKAHPTQGSVSVLTSPVDLQPCAELVECPAGVVNEAVRNAHAAYLQHRRSSLASRSTMHVPQNDNNHTVH